MCLPKISSAAPVAKSAIVEFFLSVANERDMRYAICDMQYAICNMRCAMCDMRCAMCDVRCTMCDVRCAIFACFVGRMMETAADEEGQRGVIINTASVAAYEGQVRDTFQRRFFCSSSSSVCASTAV